MRIVDHRSFQDRRQKQAKNKKLGAVALSSFIALLLILAFVLRFNTVDAPTSDSQQPATSSVASTNVNGTTTEKNPTNFFTGEQFQELYESLAFPNTELLRETPVITGNQTADGRIKQIAESRGYALRSVPIFPIVKTDAPRLTTDDLLQPKAYEAWLELEKAARADNIPLQLNSGYRSVEAQRELFIERLKAAGASTQSIAAGTADSLVTQVLLQAAPPGYSRHHTGYTIDLFCNDGSGAIFEKTTCFTWLKENNYEQAKQTGWVPSYPEGADDQGPEPEPWEYVWVGVNTIYGE